MRFELEKNSYKATKSQAVRLDERHKADAAEIVCCGLPIKVFGGVYQTSLDTELMADTVNIQSNETFLEIGCGTGVVSIVISKKARFGCAVDINTLAIESGKYNCKRHEVTNISFVESDVFSNVKGKFDVIFCNPPYNDHEANDVIERMFWDPDNEMKCRFFKEVGNYLNDKGRIYFGWANFADLDLNLPFRLAKENGFEMIDIKSRESPHKSCTFYVFEFKKNR